jgi:D-alanine-D-alanine ligase-like ATP-grasp enzyme
MKLAVLHPSYEGSVSLFKDLEPECDPARYLPEHHWTNFRIAKATAARQVSEIARLGFDAVVNLCDGAGDEDRAGIEVVQALEKLNVAFTGAGSAFYDPSREAMKMACHSAGVDFPAYIVAGQVEDAQRAMECLRFPLIVKHPHGYSSIGMTAQSRVVTEDQLGRQLARTISEFGSALVEEFIEGREFTVLVAEGRDEREEAWALQPVEFLFPEGESFKHFDLKWKDYEQMRARIAAEEPLAARLREASALAFRAMGGTGYGRCDLRVDANGAVHFLEINPYCGVFYPDGQFGSADFILAADPAGHSGFLEHLLACAIRRRDRARRLWELRYHRARGFGLFTTRPVRTGEIVEPYEERAHILVSRRHVERSWHGLRRQWFQHYAWPVTNNLNVMWSADPGDWRPINHACDPNTWLDGLDLVARRDMGLGEELTIDYATFCGSAMAAFECQCGSPDCRRVVLGTDHLLPMIRERYGDHVSDFVRDTWRSTGPDWQPPFEIAQNSYGVGLYSRRAWLAWEVVSPLRFGAANAGPTRWTVQFSQASHAEPQPFQLRYVNHSCAPNVQFDLEGGILRAIRDIEPGDELVYFYPSTEWEMAETFDCKCGSVDCLGRIGGASQLPSGVWERQLLAGHIRASLIAARRNGCPPSAVTQP